MDGKQIIRNDYVILGWLAFLALGFIALPMVGQDQQKPTFITSDQCIACHSNMVTVHGDSASIGHTWRASLMAQSAKDPYWQAAVRREIADRPHRQKEIEDVCSVCHMPMFRTTAVASGRLGEFVRYLEDGFAAEERVIAEEGVSCTVCHQISAENYGEHGSFDGGYIIMPSLLEQGKIVGPYDVNAGLKRVMHSASGKLPEKGEHIQQSELCATCHTLFTPAVDNVGTIIGEFAEQVPYLEWKHSAFANTTSCQKCHMPEVASPVPISSVLGEERNNVSQHVFLGGNAFMLQLLNKYRDDLQVTTPSEDLEHSVTATLTNLHQNTASVKITNIEINGNEALVELNVLNKTGHKLPTAYPSRRAWLNVVIHDQNGKSLFESGASMPDGSIFGNVNDINGDIYEPHYDEITSEDQVQIYEPIIHDYSSQVTTSLLSGVRYAKDNRLLPRGFDKAKADEAVGVFGAAANDVDFREGGDRIRYRIKLPDGVEKVKVTAKLLYQTIGYRWAKNLKKYASFEAKRFSHYYQANADISTIVLATATRD